MSPVDDVEIELNRLGGIDAALVLFLRRSAHESNHFYLGRLQLGAALVACKIAKIDLRSAPPERGGTRSKECGVDWRDSRERNAEGRSTEVSSWGPKCLVLVLEAFARGGCSPQARSILLPVAAALGRSTHAAGVTPLLFDLLSDGIARKDAQCCRHISRALALGLHESQPCAAVTARDRRSVSILLTLALRSQVEIPSPNSDFAEKTSAAKSRSIGHYGSEECFWDDSVRENALSCLVSMAKADDAVTKFICMGGGLKPIFVLAMGEEAPIVHRGRSFAGERRTSGRRPHTSLPKPPDPSSRTNPVPSIPFLSGGGVSRDGRPMTTGASPSTRHSSKCDREMINSKTSASIADSIRRRGSLTESVTASDSIGGGKEGRHGARLDRTAGLAATHRCVATATGPITASLPPSLTREGVAPAQDKSQPASPVGSSAHLRPPRQPMVDEAREDGAAERGKRLALQATAILLACLRTKTPRVTADAGARSEWHDRPSLSRQASEEAADERKPGRRTSAPRRKAAAVGIEPARTPAVAEPTAVSSASRSWHGSRNKRVRPHGAVTVTELAPAGDKRKKIKASPRRLRGRHRSLPSWRGRARARAMTLENTGEPRVAGVDAREGGPVLQASVPESKTTEPESVASHILGNAAAKDGNKKGGLTALQELTRDRRLEGRGTAGMAFSELEHVCGAISRAPELLNASHPLHQELGVVILERGIEESTGEEQQNAERNAGRSEQAVADEGGRQDERRCPHAVVARQRTKRRLPSQIMLVSWIARCKFAVRNPGGGTSLRSLCWLLLHRRSEVSEGAAAVLLASAGAMASVLTPTGSGSAEKWRHDHHFTGAPVPCPLPSRRICRPNMENGAASAATEPVVTVATSCGCGSISRQAAREVLSAVVDEACSRHVKRLVHSVTSSGNRGLRANVSLGLIILCTSARRRQGGQVWRSFVSSGALAAVLGMMRSPTARPASVSFLRAVSALLDGVPAPHDGLCLSGLFGVSKKKDGPEVVEGHEGVGNLVDRTKSGEEGCDTVVLVRDPLASLSKEDESRGGKAEAEGIKMACPPRDVICLASPVLRRLILDTPQEQLPLLHGRYRTWEEASFNPLGFSMPPPLMAHMGAPHTFATTNASYSTEFVLEMLVLATTFKIESQANGYAHELRRRLGHLVSDRASRSKGLAFDRQATGKTRTKAAEAPLFEGSDTHPNDRIRIEREGDKGATETGNPEALEREEREAALSPLRDRRLFRIRPGPTTRSSGSSGSDGSGEVSHRRRAESTVFEMLEAAVRCRHAWLCGEVFREASTMMGAGEGEGLPPSPRDLTAVLALLRQFLSFLWV
ncbi:unnamed protein product, partial [Scytosiphon promiscuus]